MLNLKRCKFFLFLNPYMLNFLTPKILKMFDPILISSNSYKNATP